MTTDNHQTGSHQTGRDGPRGAPHWVTLDGIVEGSVGDLGLLTEAVRGLDALGLGRFEFDRDGGRFSILPDNAQRTGAQFNEKRQARLIELLTTLARGAKGPLESTLRCTMVYAEQCAETLFRAATPPPAGPGIEPLTRLRALQPGDAPSVPPPLPWHKQLTRRQLLVGLPALALLLAVVGWQLRIVERIYGTDAEALRVDSGPFGDLLAVRVENELGDYMVTIGRGPGYPVTSAEWEDHLAAAATESERLHATIVREGRTLYVRLRDDEQRVLAEARSSLLALATGADGSAHVLLPGDTRASTIRLSVTAHSPK